MFDLDHWHEIWVALSRNKLRTLLTAFGVFWGIFMLVVMLGSGNGLQNGVNHTFAGGATNSLFVWTQRTSKPYRGLPSGRWIELTNDDTEALRRQVTDARVIAPCLQLGGYQGGNNVTRGTKAGAFSVKGNTPEILEIQAVRMLRGRFLDRPDVTERRKVAVIGSRVQDVLFEKGEDPIGEHIRINGVYFKVVGTVGSLRSGDDADEDLQTIHVPFSTFQHAFNQSNSVGWFAIVSRDDVPASTTEARVLSILAQRHSVAPDDTRAFGHFNAEERFLQFQGLFAGIRLLIWIVGSGTLAAGVIGVSNIMLVIVRERTSEIGIRRAVGATPAAITAQIVLEALILTSIAGYSGLIVGMGALDLTSSMLSGTEVEMFRNPEVDLGTAVRALLILVVSGTLAGLLPARRAIRINPVQALRAN